MKQSVIFLAIVMVLMAAVCDGHYGPYLPRPRPRPRRPWFCYHPKVVGPCYAYLERWYFDSRFGICRPFVYGGCNGNRNNYETFSECLYTCQIPLES